MPLTPTSDASEAQADGRHRYGWPLRLLRRLMFVDLPIRSKFLLLGAGTLFWFCVLALGGVAALSALQYQHHQQAQRLQPLQLVNLQVLQELSELERDLSQVQHPDGSLDLRVVQQMRQRVQTIRQTQTDLSRRFVAMQREGTVFENLLRTLADEELMGTRGIQASGAEVERIDQALAQLLLKHGGANASDNGSLAPARHDLQTRLNNAWVLADESRLQIEREVQRISSSMDAVIRHSVHALLVALLLACVLLLTFIYWIIAAFHHPITSVIRQIDSLSTGEIELAKKVQVKSMDEIGVLSDKFIRLVERVYGMTVYKRVIEEDATLEDVYRRLGQVLEHEVGVATYTLYEVHSTRAEMARVYPPLVGDARMHCDAAILSDCSQCRAVKTGHKVSSFEFQGVCRRFESEPGMGHICLPMLAGGQTIGVMQLLFPAAADGAAQDAHMAQKVFSAGTYLEQSTSVIEAKRLMQTLRESAMVDPLTGLYNRRFLQDHSQQLISGVLRRKSQIGLLLCDLDYFKQVNDSYGHDVGDLLLKQTAQVLRSAVRDADVVIRFGGEEFLILLLDVQAGEALRVAEKVRQSVEQMKLNVNGETLRKTISVGVSEFPGDTDGFWQAIKYADVALYQAKDQGRNRVLRFAPEMWQQGEF